MAVVTTAIILMLAMVEAAEEVTVEEVVDVDPTVLELYTY